MGFTVPPPLPSGRCALTAPFHPCRPAPGGVGGRFLFCGTFLRVAATGCYPACRPFGVRTFLPDCSGRSRGLLGAMSILAWRLTKLRLKPTRELMKLGTPPVGISSRRIRPESSALAPANPALPTAVGLPSVVGWSLGGTRRPGCAERYRAAFGRRHSLGERRPRVFKRGLRVHLYPFLGQCRRRGGLTAESAGAASLRAGGKT